MEKADKIHEKSNKIFHANVNWLLFSDIGIRDGKDRGAFYGWKNLNPMSFPFIYSEITGYAITSFCYIYSVLGNISALKAAKESSDWVTRNIHSNLVVARPPVADYKPNDLSRLFYSFDNGMIIIGLLNYYKITKDNQFLVLAEKMTSALIDRFFDGKKLNPRIDMSYKPINRDFDGDVVKWSTIPGAYHCKLSIGLLELSRLTGNRSFLQISDSICDFARNLQKSSGQFVTNPGSEVVFLHPHLYACEGLIYSGLTRLNHYHYEAGLNGIRWAIEQIHSSPHEGLMRNTRDQLIEQSDWTAQLLRLLILCRAQLENRIDCSVLDNVIAKLHSRLLNFYVPLGEGRGGMRYQLNLDSVCSWCTMFSMQALKLWSVRKSLDLGWMDYFI